MMGQCRFISTKRTTVAGDVDTGVVVRVWGWGRMGHLCTFFLNFFANLKLLLKKNLFILESRMPRPVSVVGCVS